jgi:ribosomal protein L24
MAKMKIKKGDTVQVLTGKDKGGKHGQGHRGLP